MIFQKLVEICTDDRFTIFLNISKTVADEWREKYKSNPTDRKALSAFYEVINFRQFTIQCYRIKKYKPFLCDTRQIQEFLESKLDPG